MPLLAGAIYCGIVLAAGVALGVLRVTFIAPAIGPFWAVALELPFMLAASWWTSGWLARRFAIASRADAIMMGTIAFVLLIAAEAGLAIYLGGARLDQLIASYGAPERALGLAGQVASVCFRSFGRDPTGLKRRRPGAMLRAFMLSVPASKAGSLT